MSHHRPSSSPGGPHRPTIYLTAPPLPSPSPAHRMDGRSPRVSGKGSTQRRTSAFDSFDAPAYCHDMAGYIAEQLALRPKKTSGRDQGVDAGQDGWRGGRPSQSALADVSVQTERRQASDEEHQESDDEEEEEEEEVSSGSEVDLERTQQKTAAAEAFLQRLQEQPSHVTDTEMGLEEQVFSLFGKVPPGRSSNLLEGEEEGNVKPEVQAHIAEMLAQNAKTAKSGAPLIQMVDDGSDRGEGSSSEEDTDDGESSSEEDEDEDEGEGEEVEEEEEKEEDEGDGEREGEREEGRREMEPDELLGDMLHSSESDELVNEAEIGTSESEEELEGGDREGAAASPQESIPSKGSLNEAIELLDSDEEDEGSVAMQDEVDGGGEEVQMVGEEDLLEGDDIHSAENDSVEGDDGATIHSTQTAGINSNLFDQPGAAFVDFSNFTTSPALAYSYAEASPMEFAPEEPQPAASTQLEVVQNAVAASNGQEATPPPPPTFQGFPSFANGAGLVLLKSQLDQGDGEATQPASLVAHPGTPQPKASEEQRRETEDGLARHARDLFQIKSVAQKTLEAQPSLASSAASEQGSLVLGEARTREDSREDAKPVDKGPSPVSEKPDEGADGILTLTHDTVDVAAEEGQGQEMGKEDRGERGTWLDVNGEVDATTNLQEEQIQGLAQEEELGRLARAEDVLSELQADMHTAKVAEALALETLIEDPEKASQTLDMDLDDSGREAMATDQLLEETAGGRSEGAEALVAAQEVADHIVGEDEVVEYVEEDGGDGLDVVGGAEEREEKGVDGEDIRLEERAGIAEIAEVQEEGGKEQDTEAEAQEEGEEEQTMGAEAQGKEEEEEEEEELAAPPRSAATLEASLTSPTDQPKDDPLKEEEQEVIMPLLDLSHTVEAIRASRHRHFHSHRTTAQSDLAKSESIPAKKERRSQSVEVQETSRMTTRQHCSFQVVHMDDCSFVVPGCAIDYTELQPNQASVAREAGEEDNDRKEYFQLTDLEDQLYHRIVRVMGGDINMEVALLPEGKPVYLETHTGTEEDLARFHKARKPSPSPSAPPRSKTTSASPIVAKRALRKSVSRAPSEAPTEGSTRKRRSRNSTHQSDADGDLADYIPEEGEGEGEERIEADQRPAKKAKGNGSKEEVPGDDDEEMLDVSILEGEPEEESPMDTEEAGLAVEAEEQDTQSHKGEELPLPRAPATRSRRRTAPRKSDDSTFRLTKVESESEEDEEAAEAQRKRAGEREKKRTAEREQRRVQREARQQEKEAGKREEAEAERLVAGLQRKKRVSEDAKSFRPHADEGDDVEEEIKPAVGGKRRSSRRKSQAPS